MFTGGTDRVIRLYNPEKDELSLIREFSGGHGKGIRDIAVTFQTNNKTNEYFIKKQKIDMSVFTEVAYHNCLCFFFWGGGE